MRSLQIDILVRIEKSNLNAQITEGNLTTLKKFKDVDGKEYIFISATSIKYWVKERMKELIPEIWKNEKEMPQISIPERGEVLYTPAKPITYIDADLFGYLDAQNNKKRYAPIKFSGLISIYPYFGDIDFGVRFDPESTDHTLHHVEITSNLFRGTWMILIDWIGRFIPNSVGMSEEEIEDANKKDEIKKRLKELYLSEYKKLGILAEKELKIGIEKVKVKELPLDERKRRLKVFLKALFTMHHFTKQTNLLTDTQPRFSIFTLTKVAKLVFFDRLSATIESRNGRKIISFTKDQIESIKNTLIQHKDIIERIVIVYDPTSVDVSPLKNEIEKLFENKAEKSKIQFQTITEFLDDNNMESFLNEILREL